MQPQHALIYLAVPYTHPDAAVREQRARIADAMQARLTEQGKIVYSPISHTHRAAVEHGLPGDWQYWKRHCEAFVTRCSELIVLTIDGWLESRGVRAEIEIANVWQIPVRFLEWNDADDWVTQNQVPPRQGIDQIRWSNFAEGTWTDAEGTWHMLHGGWDHMGYRLSVRCRRKELPIG